MALKRIVVVGLGSIGQRHARLLRERSDVQLEVLEPNASVRAKVGAELGEVVAHAAYGPMLATRPDAVLLATPTPLHAEQSIAALRAGLHVLCEKPMTATLAEARQVEAAAKVSRSMYCVGFYLHFWSAMQRVKQLMRDGALGTILHVHARVGTYVTLVNSLSRYQATQPGSLFFDYAHQPDLIYWLLGEKPTSVYVPALSAGNLEFRSSPNVADVICQYDRPLLSTIHLNYVQMPQRHEYEIVGDEGWALLNFDQGTLQVGNRRTQTAETTVFEQQRDDLFRAEHDAFFNALRGERAPETSAADGLVSTAICEAAVTSWRTGERVYLQY